MVTHAKKLMINILCLILASVRSIKYTNTDASGSNALPTPLIDPKEFFVRTDPIDVFLFERYKSCVDCVSQNKRYRRILGECESNGLEQYADHASFYIIKERTACESLQMTPDVRDYVRGAALNEGIRSEASLAQSSAKQDTDISDELSKLRNHIHNQALNVDPSILVLARNVAVAGEIRRLTSTDEKEKFDEFVNNDMNEIKPWRRTRKLLKKFFSLSSDRTPSTDTISADLHKVMSRIMYSLKYRGFLDKSLTDIEDNILFTGIYNVMDISDIRIPAR